MRFKFDPNQEYQTRAIDAVTNLFEGQPRVEVAAQFILGAGFATVGNRLDLDETTQLQNLDRVQHENKIAEDADLKCIEGDIETVTGKKQVRFPNFSTEMETGTGKTYVYIRTMLELFRRYGMRKFIVVVPSVAIREGVLQDLEMTRLHFRELYGNVPYRYYAYDSSNLSQVRQFSSSDSLEMMIMTIDSFNKASNLIRQSTDRLQGETPIHLVQAARPILILDEPQNMESELRVRALASLDPLFALRYSATHRNPYNLVYRLTPYDAYRQGLVKRIEVAGIVSESDFARPFLRLVTITAKRKTVTARIVVHKLMKTGAVKETAVTVKLGDSLEQKASRPEYADYVVEEINASGGFVRLGSNFEVMVGEAYGADREAIFDAQVRFTVEEHFRKQARLKDQGVKVLSLFFIDKVDNYASGEGIIRRLFEKAFDELKQAYPDWQSVSVGTVQAAYFAKKRRRAGVEEYVDSVTGETKEDEEAYDLIMRDKQRLLSLYEPRAFIFSHSALREGWDNPNVFQICTLNQTASEVKKRQEVGRGVRLARNQDGERIHDEKINVLTVVANESYEKYVGRLQSEIAEEYGEDGVPPKPANARKRRVATLQKAAMLKPEFKELWERIKHKTRYAVKIDTEKLVDEASQDLGKVTVRAPRVAVTKAEVRLGETDMFEALQVSAAKTAVDLVGRYPLPNLVDIMAHMLEYTSPPVRLTRRTLLEVFRRTTAKPAALENPHEFATQAVRILKDRLAEHLVRGIQYTKLNEWYEMSQFGLTVDSWEDYLVPTACSIYDYIEVESKIEREFVEGLEKRKDVKLYVKLPGWFRVHTPVGEYNPDWAIVMEERDAHGQPTQKPLLYLVRETKDKDWQTSLRPSERRKIVCGERHFKNTLGVDYKVVSSASEI